MLCIQLIVTYKDCATTVFCLGARKEAMRVGPTDDTISRNVYYVLSASQFALHVIWEEGDIGIFSVEYTPILASEGTPLL